MVCNISLAYWNAHSFFEPYDTVYFTGKAILSKDFSHIMEASFNIPKFDKEDHAGKSTFHLCKIILFTKPLAQYNQSSS